jgi:hypothetical protein
MEHEIKTNADMEAIGIALSEASKYNLQTEVVYFAMDYLKKNPSKTIAEAITYGYYEWIK